MPDEQEQALNQAYDDLERELPASVARALRWLRDPQARWVRIPLGLGLVGLSFLWFLPVIGIEFLPIGLLLIAQDVPPLRAPMARFTLWMVQQWVKFRRWLSTRSDN